MTAKIFIKRADDSGSIESGEIDGHDRVVSELIDRYESGPSLSETDMHSLVREKIENLIRDDTVTEDSADAFLESFREALHKWQREPEKVVLLLKYSDYVVISHGHTEDGSYSTGDEYEVGERILDTDNIISSAKVTQTAGDEFQLEYHSRSKSDYFRRYIGLSDATTEEVSVYITFDYNGEGINTYININESEFIENPNISISPDDCTVSLYGDDHPLQKISWNGSTYAGSHSHRLRAFLSDLDKKRDNLHTHDNKVKNIDSIINKSADVEVVEDINHVRIGDTNYSKIGTEGDIIAIYATEEYDYLTPEFLNRIIDRVVNGSVLRLYAPSAGYSRDPLTIPTSGEDCRIEFKSIDHGDVDSPTKEVLDSVYEDIDENIRDEIMAKMLTRILFELVNISSDTNTDYLSKACQSFTISQSRAIEHESDIIEYKQELADDLEEQIIRESDSEGLKLIIWGIAEDEKYQVTPLDSTPDSDTCRQLERRCREQASLEEIKIHEVEVNSDDASGKIMLGLMLGNSSASDAVAQIFG
jgi:hypothetical protein